jgi:alpha-glucosidase
VKPLSRAALVAGEADYLRFDLERDWQCRVYVLGEGIGRVVFLKDGALKEPRTWMVTTDGVDVPWQGRDRLDVAAFARPEIDVQASAAGVIVTAGRMTIDVALDPFAIAWSIDGQRFAEDRRTYAYGASDRDPRLHHFMVRHATDQYFGLGDKTGALDKHGRRLRTLALDALGYDARTSDPLYKHWPFFIVRSAESGIACGFFYDSLAPLTFDLGCEHDNYHGF